METILVPKIGFCFGVKRAVYISVETLNKKQKPCYVLGPLVHNEFVVERLKKKGVRFIDSFKDANGGTIVISAHGEDPKVLEEIKMAGYGMVDATCPLVTRVQNLAKELQKKGSQVIIIGDKSHKEIKSIQAAIGGNGIIVNSEKEAQELGAVEEAVSVIVQTTHNPIKVKSILKELKKKFKNLEFCDTLCHTVQNYQKAVKELAPKVDLMLIVGSKTSANTKRLEEIAKESGKRSYHVESDNQLQKEWFDGVKKVGIAGGTSTPGWLIKDVVNKINILFPKGYEQNK